MTGRLVWLGLGLALFVAVAPVPGCYNPPKPRCGFFCGTADECPTDYTCFSDNRCHLTGTPRTSCTAVDAGPDAPPIFPDAPLIVDAPPRGLDAPPDAVPDAPPDAVPDAPPDAVPDAPADAPPDAPPDAPFDAPPDA